MLSEEQYNKVKKLLKKSVKQYAIAEKLKISNREVGNAKRAFNYEGYKMDRVGLARYGAEQLSKEVENVFLPKSMPLFTGLDGMINQTISNEDIYKLLLEIKDLQLKQNARQGV